MSVQSSITSVVLTALRGCAWSLAIWGGGIEGLAAELYTPQHAPAIEERWRWTEVEALTGNDFFTAAEGKDGSVWLASRSGEVAHYDGIRLEHYHLGGGEPVVGIAVGNDGRLYALTKYTFVVLQDDGSWKTLLDQTIEPVDYYRIYQGEDGAIWIGVWNGVYRFDGEKYQSWKTGRFWFRSMLVDRAGGLWLTPEDRQEVLVFDTTRPEGGTLPLVHRFEVPGLRGSNRLFMDPEGRVWILNPDESGHCYLYENYERKLGASGLGSPFRDAPTFRMAALPSGRCWFAVPRALAELRDHTAQRFSDATVLPTAVPWILPLSSESLLIGGAESKTYLIDLSTDRWATYLGLNYQCRDHAGREWFLSHEAGVVAHDLATDTWLAYGEGDGLIDAPNRVYSSSDGTVWVSGSHEGAAAVAWQVGDSWERRSFPNLATIISHLSVLEIAPGRIVFGGGTPGWWLGNRTGGAVVFRKHGDVWEPQPVVPPAYPSRPAIIVKRGEAETWFGGEDLFKLAEPDGRVPTPVRLFEPRRWIDHLAVDSAGHLWLAAWGDGIREFDGESWRRHTETEGLASNQTIYLLPSEIWGGVWAATAQGLSHFDGEVWSNWHAPFGKSFTREGVTLFEGGDGALWINHAYRAWLLEGRRDERQATLFETHRYRKDGFAPETFAGEIQDRLPEGSPVVLRWSGLDRWSQTPAGELEFSWRLGEGAWSGFSRATDTVLNGVGAGKYVFEVRARDRDWNVDATPARVVIQVIPPLWKRPWFIGLVVATVALIVFLIERLFKTRVRAALAVEEFKLDFFTNISHELRNPLAVILGPIESVLRGEKSPEDRKRLNLALRSARKMQALVDQLLQFRKVEIGKATCRPAPGELVGFVREAVELHEPLWRERGLTVKFEANLERCVCAFDADKLQKIVDNLVSNAIKYSAENGAVCVRLNVTESEGRRQFDLVVEDHGRGIPEHEIAMVMKPFYRVRGGRDAESGFGIGLALVAGLVRVCDGSVQIESPIDQQGKGTRVTVTMPVGDAALRGGEEKDDEDESAETVQAEEAARTGPRATVLLVEDNLELRQFMRDELASRHDILEASDGQEGFDIALKENPDLIITDVAMPGMDGYAFCRKIRDEAETSHIPIIMLTAKSAEEHSVEGMEAGADVFFTKPVNMLKLSAQIDSLLDLRRKMQQRFSELLVVEPTELAIVPADQEVLRKAIQVVEEHMSDPDFGVDEFSRLMGMGRTALLKKLKALTGEAPGAFIRTMRLKRAAQLLASGEVSVSETLEHVGILDASYFSRAFKRQFGVAPSQYSRQQQDD